AVADGTASAYDGKVDVLKQAAGVRFDALELSCLMFFVNPPADPGVLATTVAPMFGLTPQEMLDSPLALFGSCDQMVERLQARRDRWGVSYLVCRADSIYELAPVVERLAGT